MEKTLKELYREQYECYTKLSQEDIERLYASEGIELDSLEIQLKELKNEIKRKKDELPSPEERLLSTIFGTDRYAEQELNEIKRLEQQFNDLEKTYNNLSFQSEFDIEDMLKVIKTKIENKRKLMEANNAKNIEKKELALKQEIKELENKYELLQRKYNNFYKQFHKVVRGIIPKNRKFPSKELRNKIVEGTLGIAKYWATIYFRKSDNTQSFDDLHQIANQALISAAYYYIPSNRAKFTTYARKCIENQLKKAVYSSKKMKKRPYNAKDFFQKEKDLINYVKWFLNASSCVSENNILECYPHVLRRFRIKIREYNRELSLFGEYKRSFQSCSYASAKNRERFDEIISNVIKILKNSKLKVLLSEDEINLINLWLNYNNELTPLNELFYYLNSYIKKLDQIEKFLNIEKKLQSKNDGITPSLQEILEEFNKRIKIKNKEKYRLKQEGFYKKMPFSYKTPATYYGLYMDEYNVDPLISADLYEDGYNASKAKEKDDILREREDSGDYYWWQINNFIDEIKALDIQDNQRIVFDYDSDFEEIEDYYVHRVGKEVHTSLGYYKIFTKEEAIKELEKLLQKYENDDDYLKRILKERKDNVNNLLNEVNSEIFEYNKEMRAIEDKYVEGSSYEKYLKEDDILNIKSNIELLYAEDLELFILLNDNKERNRTFAFPVEEEALSNLFMQDYYKELDKLTNLEREVLLRYFDSLGQHSVTAKEIGNDLGITPAKVYKEKDKALKKLQNSKIMQSYIEE